MIITTTDPITGEDLTNLDTKPFVVEGKGHLAVKIYFESEETRRCYLDSEVGEHERELHYSLEDLQTDVPDLN